MRHHSISIVGYPPQHIVGRPSIVSSAGNISLGSSPTTLSEEIRTLSQTLQRLSKRKDVPESRPPSSTPSRPTERNVEMAAPTDLAEALVPAGARIGNVASKLAALADRCSDMELELSDLRHAVRQGSNSQPQLPYNITRPHANLPLVPLMVPTVPSYAAPLKSQNPRVPPSPRDAKPFALSLPSSVKVTEIPRALAPADLISEIKARAEGSGGVGNHGTSPSTATNGAHNPNFRELQKIMCSSVYNVLEAVVSLCQADSGRIMTKQYPPETTSVSRAPEMVSICNVGEKIRFPPSLVRQQCEGSLAASVLATGVAVHQRTLGKATQRAEAGGGASNALAAMTGLLAELNGSTGKQGENSKGRGGNRAPARAAKHDSNVLVFPIRKPIADSGIAHPEYLSAPMHIQQSKAATTNIIAVLVVENKGGGATPFTAVDENLCNMASRVLGEIMSRIPSYALDWSANFFDPIPLHVVTPFLPFSATPSQADNQQGSFFLTKLGEEGGLGAKLQQHAAEQLIRRTVIQPISAGGALSPNAVRGEGQSTTTVFGGDNTTASALSTTSTVAGLGQAPTLREVDAFLANLHECWQQTVRTVVDQQHVEHKQHSEMKAVREELLAAKKKISDLEHTLRLHKLDTSEYKVQYGNLQQELQTYLRKKTRMDDD